MNQAYKSQVKLLLDVLPEVSHESCFALHGGTAINLFIRNMPRLSVDIDLTYLPIEDRPSTIENIAKALSRIKSRLESKIPRLSVLLKKETGKLLINTREASIKLEVNLVARGVISKPEMMTLCERAQEEFQVFCEIQVVPLGQLYGGKICAALDRQHPRDLFDIKYLLQNEGMSDKIIPGFLYCLLGSERPIFELLKPNFLDQRKAMENQFNGMTLEPFSYEEYVQTRIGLIELIKSKLSKDDKEFLLQFENATPIWETYDFADYPSIRWKLQNLEILKKNQPAKHTKIYQNLQVFFHE